MAFDSQEKGGGKVAGQRAFDFAAAATDARRRELAELLESLGLTRAEILVVTFVWAHGATIDNRTAVTVSQRVICRDIGYSRTYTREAIDNLVAFGILADASNGAGKPLSYLVDWSRIRTMEPVRVTGEIDPFAAFEASTPTTAASGTQGCAQTGAVTCAPGCSESGTETYSLGGTQGCAPQSQNTQISNPQNNHTHTQSNEGWGKDVSDAEMRSWAGRTALFRRAAEINPLIDTRDPDDRIGFIAAVLCALERANKPPAMLLHFVRQRAWRHRGRGGLDGHWIGKANATLREREKERRQPVGV